MMKFLEPSLIVVLFCLLPGGGLSAQEPQGSESGEEEAGKSEAGGSEAVYSITPISLVTQNKFSPDWDFSVPVDLYVLQNKEHQAEIKPEVRHEVLGEDQRDKDRSDGNQSGENQSEIPGKNMNIEFLEERDGGSIYRINIDGVYYFASVTNTGGVVIEVYFDETGSALFLYEIGFNDGNCVKIEQRFPVENAAGNKSALTIFNYDNMNNITEIKKTDENGIFTGVYRGIYGKFGIKYHERTFSTADNIISENMEIQYNETGLPVAARIFRNTMTIKNQDDDEAETAKNDTGSDKNENEVETEILAEDIFVDYTYKFDDSGNWIECTALYKKELLGILLPFEQVITRREIIYE